MPRGTPLPCATCGSVAGTYEADEGTRQLVGQRVDGIVRTTDRRKDAAGRSYLVDEGIGCMAELDAIIARVSRISNHTAGVDEPEGDIGGTNALSAE